MTDGIFETIHVKDPAVAWQSVPGAVYDQWKETRDTALLAPYFIPGKQPIVFRLREISGQLMDGWVKHGNEPKKGETSTTYRRAFQCSVVMVSNMPNRDGVIRPEWIPPTIPGAGLFAGVLTEEGADAFTSTMRTDVGALAYQRSDFLPGTEPCFQLPDSFQDSLGPPARRSVVQNSVSPAQPSETP